MLPSLAAGAAHLAVRGAVEVPGHRDRNRASIASASPAITPSGDGL
jgi:hypothetical protein